LYEQNSLLYLPIQNHQNYHNYLYNPIIGENNYSFSISDSNYRNNIILHPNFRGNGVEEFLELLRREKKKKKKKMKNNRKR
jgi:hypothetical protein